MRIRITPFAVSLLTMIPSMGSAQEAGAAVDTGGVEELVVRGFRQQLSTSATNSDAALIETPATVNVLTDEFLDTLGIRGLEEATQYVPGAGGENAGDPFSPKLNLRGFTVNSLTSGGVYVDGYQAVRRGYHFDNALYDRIDVLKGTSSLLYGLATPGGVVNHVAKKPQFEPAVNLEASLGSFDTLRATADLTGALNTRGTLAGRMILSVQSANQTVNGDNSDLSFEDRLVFSPSLTWEMPTGGELHAAYEYSEIESVFDPGIKRLDSGQILFDTEPYVGPASGFDREFEKGKIELTQPLGEQWEFLVGGVFTRSDNVSRIDASFFGNLDGNPMPRWTARSIEDYEQSEIRAELSGRIGMGNNVRHELNIGVNVLNAEVSVDRANVTTNAAIDPFNPRFGPAPALPDPVPWFNIGSDPERSIYIQDYVSIGDTLNIFGGIRHTDFEIFREHTLADDFRNSDGVIDWNAGVIYNHSARFNPFASYSTSTEPQRAVNAPREGEQMEIGVKSEWLGERLATTFSIFQVEQTDIAEEFPSNSGQFVLVGDQRTRGFEFEAVGRITNRISMIGGYSHLDAEFAESTTGNKGNTPHSVPRHKVSLFGEYAFAGSLQGWRTSLGFIHTGERFGNNANTFELPGYERLDLSVNYTRGPLDFRVSIENILDENYIFGSGGNGHQLAQGAPRFITLTLGYEM